MCELEHIKDSGEPYLNKDSTDDTKRVWISALH